MKRKGKPGERSAAMTVDKGDSAKGDNASHGLSPSLPAVAASARSS